MLIWQQERVLKRLVLSPPERQRLRERVRSPRRRAEEVQRAKNILLIASGKSQWAVSRQLGCSINTVRFWLNRFVEERLAGLFSRHRGKVADQQSAKLEAWILAAARQKPRMARRTGVLGSWQPNLAPTIREWPVFWLKPDCSPTAFAATWPAKTRIMKPRLPISSA